MKRLSVIIFAFTWSVFVGVAEGIYVDVFGPVCSFYLIAVLHRKCMMHLTQKLYDFRHYYVGCGLIMPLHVNEVASVCFLL